MILLGGVSAWAAGCGSDDEPAGGSAGSGGAAGSDAGDNEDASLGGSSGSSGASGGGGAPADAAAEAATLGESCESVLCAAGFICSEDPCAEDFCPQTCKKEVASCSAPSACAAGQVCVTKIEFPTVRNYCIEAAKAFARCDPISWDTCVEGYFCGQVPFDSGEAFARVCLSRSGAGESCVVEKGSCVDGYRCQNGVCTARKPAGEACVSSSECLEGHFCSQDSDTCEAVHQAGGACRAANAICKGSDCLYFSDYCAEGLVCDKDGATGCFHDTNCTGNEQFCCLPGIDADAGADAAVVDAGNVGACSTDFKCLRPVGKCATPPAP